PALSLSRSPPLCSSLSLHGALPISWRVRVFLSLALERAVPRSLEGVATARQQPERGEADDAKHRKDPRGGQRSGRPAARTIQRGDRKSTRLNSSHVSISYAVFCLKK